MTHILIVDDDKIICTNMKRFLLRQLKQPVKISTVYDGTEAVEFIQSQKVHLIISDVKMKKMDGIEFVDFITKSGYTGDIIFISGYADKAILKAAFQLHAVTFLEKPVDPDELLKEVSNCLERQKQQTEQQRVADFVDDHKGTIIDAIMKNLLVSSDDPSGKLAQVDFLYPRFSAIGNYILLSATGSSSVALFDALKNFLNNYTNQILYTVENNTFIAVFPSCKNSKNEEFCRQLQQYLTTLSFSDNFVAVSPCFSGLRDIPKQYSLLTEILKSAFWCTTNTCFNACHSQTFHMGTLIELASPLLFPAKSTDISRKLLLECEHSISAFLTLPKFTWCTNSNAIQKLLLEVGEHLYLLYSSASTTDSVTKNKYRHLHTQIQSQTSLSGYWNALFSLFDAAQEMTQLPSEPSNVYCKSAVQFIQASLHKPITLDDVAEHCQVSPAYLNRIFKQETNITIPRYILSQKMLMAQQLLIETPQTIQEISNTLAFYDSNHFIKCFKKEFGCTPLKYKNSHFEKNTK